MGIDGIGKGGRINPGMPKAAESIVGKQPASPVSEVSPSAPPDAPGPLERLERGEISFDEYVEQRVIEAVSHLETSLSVDQLAFVREQLSEQMQTDPVLTDLVRRAAGRFVAEP